MANVITVADAAAAVAAHPVSQQAISSSSALVPLIAALAGIGGALGSQWLSHRFTLNREKKASEDKLLRERYFIATELVFLLEQFAEGCARVAADAGDDGPQMERQPKVSLPAFTLADVSGDWRALDARIMYRVREIPVMQNEARRTMAGVSEHDDPIYATGYFRERQYQYARLGMKALILAMRLRRAVGLPESRLHDTKWSAYTVLWRVWRRERKRRAAEFITNKE